jgi:hypothetical protein
MNEHDVCAQFSISIFLKEGFFNAEKNQDRKLIGLCFN